MIWHTQLAIEIGQRWRLRNHTQTFGVKSDLPIESLFELVGVVVPPCDLLVVGFARHAKPNDVVIVAPDDGSGCDGWKLFFTRDGLREYCDQVEEVNWFGLAQAICAPASIRIAE